MSYEPHQCPICNTNAERGFHQSPSEAWHEYFCACCGEFSAPVTVSPELKLRNPVDRAKISAFVRNEFDLGERPALTRTLIDRVLARPTPPLTERIERLLQWAAKRQQVVHQVFKVGAPELVAVTHSRNVQEVIALLQYLMDETLVKRVSMDGTYQVTPRGFMHSERAINTSTSRNGFIAMWFDAGMAEARTEGLMPGVANAAYTPILVNNVEHINRIDDEIISQIRKSKFLVADFTGHRGGVYFEAGFAMGLNLPVFWTCRKDDMAKLHFDIRQYNCIDWETPQELATRLQNRIEAIVGQLTV